MTSSPRRHGQDQVHDGVVRKSQNEHKRSDKMEFSHFDLFEMRFFARAIFDLFEMRFFTRAISKLSNKLEILVYDSWNVFISGMVRKIKLSLCRMKFKEESTEGDRNQCRKWRISFTPDKNALWR